MQISQFIHTMYYLVNTQYRIFLQTIKDKYIDLFIWVIAMAAVTIYLLPSFGLATSYGTFMIASMAASAGLFEQFSSTVNLIGDFEGDNITSFYLTLPMPSWMVFLSYGIFYAFNTMVLTAFVLPISKLIFWNHLNVSQLNVLKYGLMLFATSSFYASFTLWMASFVASLQRVGSVWMRFTFPIWTFGAFQYSYAVLFDLNPWLGYASLLNPMTYVMEGTRAAVLGQEGSLNVWMCIALTFIFSLLFASHGIYRIKRRLDYV